LARRNLIEPHRLPGGARGLTAGDFDGDGRAELVWAPAADRLGFATVSPKGPLRCHTRPIPESFPLATSLPSAIRHPPSAISSPWPGEPAWFRPYLEAAAIRDEELHRPLPASDPLADLAAGDVDGDGRDDLVVGAYLLPAGEPAAAIRLPELAATPPPFLTRLGDLNADGRADVVRYRRSRWPHVGQDILAYLTYTEGDPDPDSDGLSTDQEKALGTDPLRRDTDGDGLLDGWEVNGVRGLDLPAWGVNPLHRDILIEVQPVDDVPPAEVEKGFTRIVQFYADLPVDNPDGTTGLALHPIFRPAIPKEESQGRHWGEVGDEFWPAAHRGVAHWMQVTSGGGGQSGQLADKGSCGVGGLYHTFLHEFGHQLGLDHTGGWEPAWCPLYPSLMNYAYNYSFNGRSDLVHYSTGEFADTVLSEANLSERLPYPHEKVAFLAQAPYHYRLKADGDATYVDWNWNGLFEDEPVRADINYGYSTSGGPRQNLTGRTIAAPFLVVHEDTLYLFFVQAPAGLKEDCQMTAAERAAQAADPPTGPLMVQTYLGEPAPPSPPFKRGGNGGVWTEPVEVVSEAISGDPFAVSHEGQLFLFYPTKEGVRWHRGQPRRPGPAHLLPDSVGAEVTAVVYDGQLIVFLWTGPDEEVQYRLWNGETFGPRLSLGVKSTFPPGPAVDTLKNQLLLGMGQDQDEKRPSRWQVRRFEWEPSAVGCRLNLPSPRSQFGGRGWQPSARCPPLRRGGQGGASSPVQEPPTPNPQSPTLNPTNPERKLTDCGFVWVGGEQGGERGTRRPLLFFETSPAAGPEGRIHFLGPGLITEESRKACYYDAMQIADKTVREGWLIKRYYDEWTQSRSSPGAAWYQGDLVLASRWYGTTSAFPDNGIYVAYHGLGIHEEPMGDHDDVTFLAHYGLERSILFLGAMEAAPDPALALPPTLAAAELPPVLLLGTRWRDGYPALDTALRATLQARLEPIEKLEHVPQFRRLTPAVRLLLTCETMTSSPLFGPQREATLAWVAQGGHLLFVGLDAPDGVRPDFFPSPLEFTDEDADELTIADVDHPLIASQRGRKYDLKQSAGDGVTLRQAPGDGWQVLATSPVGAHILALRHGQGEIAVVQIHEALRKHEGFARALAADALAWAGVDAAAHGDPVPEAETHLLQVEDFEGPWRSQTNIPGYLGAGFKTSNADGVAQTVMKGQVPLARGGRYAVWARGYEGENLNRSFSITVGGQALPPTHTRPSGGFNWQYAGAVQLEPGEVEIVVQDRGDSFEVADAVLLTTDLAYDPGKYERRRFVLEDRAAENLRLVDHLIERAVASAEAGHAEWAKAMATRETWEPARARLQQQFRAAVGLDPWPERTPLHAQLLGETEKEGYLIQRVTFESRPGFIVTANVYVPTPPLVGGRPPDRPRSGGVRRPSPNRALPPLTKGGAGGVKFPAVLCPVGHWPHSKAQEQVQARCVGLAKLGFLALTYDPFGQGERAVDGNGHHEYFRTLLAGRNNMSYMLWDTMRALDYLLTRDDVDPDRIACTGASGGGLNTLYVAAIDERIQVAVPVVYATAFAEFLRTRADHCPCSHIPGLASFADMGDVAALIAPRPMLFITASQDPQFTVAGAQHAYAEALPAYRAFGVPDALQLREFDSGHDYNRPMREALYGFLRQHLLGLGDGSPVPEPEMTLEPPDSPVLRCFESGRVPDTAATVRSLARLDAEALIASLPEPGPITPPLAKGGPGRGELAAWLHWPAAPIVAPQVEPVDRLDAPGEPEKVLLRTAEGIALPGLFYRAPTASPTALLLDESGRQALRHSPLVAALRDAGLNVFTLDVRGWGETRGREHLLATDSLLLGEPLVAQQARDTLAAAAYLRTRPDVDPGRLVLIANGVTASLVATLAAAFDDGFAAVVQNGAPRSFLDLYDRGVPPGAAVWRLLHLADWPHLRALGAAPVWVGEGTELRPAEEVVGWVKAHLTPLGRSWRRGQEALAEP